MEKAKALKESEEKEKARVEQEAKERAEREEALKPDVQKLHDWIMSFNMTNIPNPKLESDEAGIFFNKITDDLAMFLQDIEDRINVFSTFQDL